MESDAAEVVVPSGRQLRKLGDGSSQIWHLMHDQVHTEVFGGGSAGPGKTFTLCLIEVTEALRLPGTTGAIFRATAEDLRKSTLITFFDVCARCNLVDGVHFKFNESKGVVKWITGSTTYFDYLKFDPSDPNYSKLGGREYTRAFVDEADQVEERGVDVLAGRIRYKLTEFCHACAAPDMADKSTPIDCDEVTGHPTQWKCYRCGEATKGLLPKLLCTGNPGEYWTKYRYVCNLDGSPKTLQPHEARVLMLIEDNPDKAFVTTTRAQLEKGKDEYDKERLLGGNWMAVRRTGREFLHAFRTQDHVRRVAYNANEPLHITLDFNTAPYMTLLVAQIHLQADGRWHVAFIQEICLKHPESTTEASCKALLREMEEGKYKGHDRGLFYYGDASGKNRNAQATDGMFHNYDIVERVLSKHRSNHWDRVIHRNPSHTIVRDFQNSALRGERKFYVTFDPSMTNTIADHLNVKEAADGGILKVMETDHQTGVRSEKYGHCLQASYYLTVGAFPEEFRSFVRK